MTNIKEVEKLESWKVEEYQADTKEVGELESWRVSSQSGGQPFNFPTSQLPNFPTQVVRDVA